MSFDELPGLRVLVEDVIFMPHLDAPEEKPHPFVYFLTIVNDSGEAVTIAGRKWIVKDTTGDTTVVEGEGVVGETPTIKAGERFSYNSYHTVGRDSVASGAFFGKKESGGGVRVRIPDFHLKVPEGA